MVSIPKSVKRKWSTQFWSQTPPWVISKCIPSRKGSNTIFSEYTLDVPLFLLKILRNRYTSTEEGPSSVQHKHKS